MHRLYFLVKQGDYVPLKNIYNNKSSEIDTIFRNCKTWQLVKKQQVTSEKPYAIVELINSQQNSKFRLKISHFGKLELNFQKLFPY